jgi:hypothetical protein
MERTPTQHVDVTASGIPPTSWAAQGNRAPDLKALLAPIAADIQAVDAVIRERLSSDVPLINTVAEYIIGAGGKRLRPAVVLLVARALGYRGRTRPRHPAVAHGKLGPRRDRRRARFAPCGLGYTGADRACSERDSPRRQHSARHHCSYIHARDFIRDRNYFRELGRKDNKSFAPRELQSWDAGLWDLFRPKRCAEQESVLSI